MANLTIATVRTNAYTEIYNHLQTGTYAITSNNIYPNFNHEQIIKDGYPSIVINKPKINFERLTLASLGRWRVPISVEIECWHNSAANAKTVADKITEKILSGISVLRSKGMYNIEFDGDDTQTIQYTQEKALSVYFIRFKATYIGMSS